MYAGGLESYASDCYCCCFLYRLPLWLLYLQAGSITLGVWLFQAPSSCLQCVSALMWDGEGEERESVFKKVGRVQKLWSITICTLHL